MKREYEVFWTDKRKYKCDSLGLTRIEVSILASIVEEEQDKKIDERPIIAWLKICCWCGWKKMGLYLGKEKFY